MKTLSPVSLAAALISLPGLMPLAAAVPALTIENTLAGYEVGQNGINTVLYPGWVTFTATSSEPIPAGTSLSFVVERESGGGRAAEYGYDYDSPVVSGGSVNQPSTGRLEFTDSSTTVFQITFKVLTDSFMEGTEEFQVRLTDASGCTFARDRAYGTIIDDDEGWVARLANGNSVQVDTYTSTGDGERFGFIINTDATGNLGLNPHLALGDIDRDGLPEIIVGTGRGPVARVFVFNAWGTLLNSFQPYGVTEGGVFVAAGDLTGDGTAEIVTGAGEGGSPHVIGWDMWASGSPNGTPAKFVEFFPAENAFAGGIRVGCGDVDGDGRADIVTSRGPGSFSYVTTHNGVTGLPIANGARFPYDPNFLGGAYVSMCDLDRDGHSDLVIGAGETGGSHVRVWSPHRSLWLEDFILDPSTTGVLVAGKPVVLDPRGIRHDDRFPTTRRGGGTFYMAHPGTAYVERRYDAGQPAFAIDFQQLGTQAIAAAQVLEPVRTYQYLTTEAPVPVHLSTGIEGDLPGLTQRWTWNRRPGFIYDLELSSDLKVWTVRNDLMQGFDALISMDGPRTFFRVTERVFAP